MNKIFNHSSSQMPQVHDNSVDIVITSPPYYKAGKTYENYSDSEEFEFYLEMIKSVLSECYRVMKPGARICINVANLDRKPYRPLVNLIEVELVKAGFAIMGEIIWHKWDNAPTTAWGSWLMPSMPALRDTHEYIIIARKGDVPLKKPDGGQITIFKDEFLQLTNSVWKITPRSSKEHPAVFPQEIPDRLIKLFTWTNSVVLDPFSGTGTTLVSAKSLDRQYLGFEISETYYHLIKRNLKKTVPQDLEYWENFFKEA